MADAQPRSRAEQVLDALRAANPSPLNYVALFEKLGGSKSELDATLTGLVNEGVIFRGVQGYRVAVPAEKAPETMVHPADTVTPIRRGTSGARPQPKARVGRVGSAKMFHMSAQTELRVEYLAPAAEWLQLTFGDTMVECSSAQMDALCAWWQGQRA